MKKAILVISSAMLIFSSCKKSDSASCNTDVASISGSYKITGAKYKSSSSSPEIDYLSLLFSDDCERDNVTTLKSDGTYITVDAGLVCSPSSGSSGTWSLSGNTITIDSDASTVESFNCTNLVVSNTDINTSGDKLTLTLTKQ